MKETVDIAATKFVPPEERIATFDHDGTLWVEHPIYTQVTCFLERVPALAKTKPGLKNLEPFKTVLSGSHDAMAKLSMKDLLAIVNATLTGTTVDEFSADVTKWIATARHPGWHRLYTELTYFPMLELIQYLRENSFRIYIVPGGARLCPHIFQTDLWRPARAGCGQRG